MKPLTILGAVFAATLLFTACDPHRHPRTKPAPGPTDQKPRTTNVEHGPNTPVLNPEDGTDPNKPREDVKIEPKPHGNIPPPPDERGKEEYAVKMQGKPGFVTDPHDTQGRPLDVRGMPPGTKIQSPFSGSVLLVPPQ